jgi:hypothetical protein|tara:strand:- start:640 stop:795 length:156 start_codon:yes stop_codon:yes gene_type:complete
MALLQNIALFNSLTDEDFIAIDNAGQLKNLCTALSLDLQSISDKPSNVYTA